MNNDFTQSFLAAERHSDFQREVTKDELAKLAPGRARAIGWNARKLVRVGTRRALRLLPVRDA
jgi:hypothetical protein